jgi:hypothetical protein
LQFQDFFQEKNPLFFRLQWGGSRRRKATWWHSVVELQHHRDLVLLDEGGQRGCWYSIIHQIKSFAKRWILL